MKWFFIFVSLALIVGLHLGTARAAQVGTTVITTQAVTGLTQSEFRWYANADAVTPTAALAPENAATTTPISGKILRLRMNLKALGQALDPGATFALQYFQVTSTVSSSLAWISVGTSTEWVFANNPSVPDGQTITTTGLASSTVGESHHSICANLF